MAFLRAPEVLWLYSGVTKDEGVKAGDLGGPAHGVGFAILVHGRYHGLV
jgi:hypothetical protein